HRTGSRGIPEVLGILHEPEGKAVGESYELIRNPRRDLRMISTQGYLFNRAEAPASLNIYSVNHI
ncbi:MAG: hypothetical protein QXL00_06420, partial [Conexivisphaerales archaeon]